MRGAVDLLNSERGIITLVLIVAATILALVGIVNADQWMTFTKWVCVTLVASKTITGAVETVVNAQATSPDRWVPPKTDSAPPPAPSPPA